MIIGIDLNDCIMDNISHLCHMFGLQRSDFYQWDTPLGSKVGMSDNDFLTVAYKTPSTQLAAVPNSGAAEKLRSLRDVGHTIHIVTATILTVDQITNWLTSYNIPFDDIIKTKIKSGEGLLIDDSPSTIVERINKFLPIVKFNQPYNQDVECPGIDTWAELEI